MVKNQKSRNYEKPEIFVMGLKGVIRQEEEVNILWACTGNHNHGSNTC
ncbi:MAG: hypothetical protein ACP5U0_08690 [Caldisphaera sp.]